MTDFEHDPDSQPDLIGYQLGLLDDEDRQALEHQLGGSIAARDACRGLERLFAPLNSDLLEPASPDFEARILAAVDASQAVLPFARGALAAPPGQPIVTGGGSLFSMREIWGIAAAFLMFAGIFVPGYYQARQTAQKIYCANNLRLMGAAFGEYEQNNENQMPFAGFVPREAKWARRGAADDARVMPNSRHVYKLVHGRYLAPAAVICPGATGDSPMSEAAVAQLSDFPDPRNISFATNLMTRPWDGDSFVPEMPIAACMTPLVDNDRHLVPAGQVRPNSSNHGGASGQNVLRANISVRFHTTPTVGPGNDDIYRVRGVEEYTGAERPAQLDDALLVP